MKIFLGDRTIHFSSLPPEHQVDDQLIVNYQSENQLQKDWIRFREQVHFKSLLITYPGAESLQVSEPATDPFSRIVFHDMDKQPRAIIAFLNLFTLVPAAGGLVRNERDENLFIHRFGKWDLPKGKITQKELKLAEKEGNLTKATNRAAIREVKEETGLKSVTTTRELPSTWHIYADHNAEILKRTYWFEMVASGGEILKPQVSEGIFLVKWIPTSELSFVMMNTYASIRDLLERTILVNRSTFCP